MEKRISSTLKRKIGATAVVVIIFLVVGFALCCGSHRERPIGKPGPDADNLATLIENKVRVDLWNETMAVKWVFNDSHRHLWDRERHFGRVRFKDAEVFVDLNTKRGVAFEDGGWAGKRRSTKLVTKAYKYWVNDSFWLNPIAKFRDGGVELSLVKMEEPREGAGEEQLLVSYTSGGLTPGDSYLWIVDKEGMPIAWRMWVSIIPIGGLEASFEKWVTLGTGALVSTEHRFMGITLALDKVEGAKTLSELEPGEDPFAPLVEYLDNGKWVKADL